MRRKPQPIGAHALRRSFGRLLGMLIAAPVMTTLRGDAATSPTGALPPRLPEATYAALLERYRPVEEHTKRWIAGLPNSTTQVLGMQAYRAFLEAARHNWPAWATEPCPPPFMPYARDLAGFEAITIATITWVERADQELVPGILALTLLCDDLDVALMRAGAVPEASSRAPLWRPEVWPPD